MKERTMFPHPDVPPILEARKAYETKKEAFLTFLLDNYENIDPPREQMQTWLERFVGDTRLIEEFWNKTKPKPQRGEPEAPRQGKCP